MVSFAGLAAAVALQNEGFNNITIFEQDQRFNDRRQGFGMTLTNNETGALAKLGLREDCQRKNCPSTCHYIFASNGEILGYYGRYFQTAISRSTDTTTDSRSGFNLRIPRQELRQMLLARLNLSIINIMWGSKLIDYTEHEDKVIISVKSTNEMSTSDHEFDVVVGCDGIRSVVRELRDYKLYTSKSIPNPCPLKYLGVSVILGLSTYEDPLIHDRGFYVLDGVHRLFIMPFRQPEIKPHETICVDILNQKHCECINIDRSTLSPRLTMWQLSFSGMSEDQGVALRGSTPDKILSEAMNRVSSWFNPVQKIISNTVMSELWATPLYDRNPMEQTKSSLGSRVVVLGDACHPMSMFKGQGANQSMEDGPLLAKWLAKGSHVHKGDEPYDRRFNVKLLTRLKCFEREMIARTSKKVLASRASAVSLHSEEVLTEEFGIEGVDKSVFPTVLCRLRDNQVDANCGHDMDENVLKIVQATVKH